MVCPARTSKVLVPAISRVLTSKSRRLPALRIAEITGGIRADRTPHRIIGRFLVGERRRVDRDVTVRGGSHGHRHHHLRNQRHRLCRVVAGHDEGLSGVQGRNLSLQRGDPCEQRRICRTGRTSRPGVTLGTRRTSGPGVTLGTRRTSGPGVTLGTRRTSGTTATLDHVTDDIDQQFRRRSSDPVGVVGDVDLSGVRARRGKADLNRVRHDVTRVEVQRRRRRSTRSVTRTHRHEPVRFRVHHRHVQQHTGGTSRHPCGAGHLQLL